MQDVGAPSRVRLINSRVCSTLIVKMEERKKRKKKLKKRRARSQEAKLEGWTRRKE